MNLNAYLLKNKKRLIIICLLLASSGGIFSYINYGIEPQETIGGFFCGFGVALGFMVLSIKSSKN